MTSSTLRLPLFISAALMVGVAGANPRFNTEIRVHPNEGLTIAPKVEIVECPARSKVHDISAKPNLDRVSFSGSVFPGLVIRTVYPSKR